ncbi:GbsR/MarR family transcriptional regulator [Negadavirga shengliensis]|uniref:GbsR/MarR family transcriptional regulator n=1 Tax=Negadavirga shengliensis TaxID=1389218 RepID=A0ABV9T4B5_9BACT
MEKFRKKIEAYGVTMEKMGLSPVAARTYVYILYTRDPGATFEDLVRFFQVSKSAISNALKYLESVNMIDSKTIGGQRKRYFYASFDKMLNKEVMINRFKLMSDMLHDIKYDRQDDDVTAQQLENASLLYKMLIIELPIVLERWKRTIELDKTT